MMPNAPKAGCNTSAYKQKPRESYYQVLVVRRTLINARLIADLVEDRMSRTGCRQLGHWQDGWKDLPECLGCDAERDWNYISEGRRDLDRRGNRA